MASYPDAKRALTTLLDRFAPPRQRVRPDYPFWHLRKDGIWEVRGDGPITEDPGGHAHVSSLLRENAHGGFPSDVFTALQADEALAVEIAYSLVDAHFPPSLHDAVLQAAGIEPKFEHVRRRPRSTAFSKAVLAAYGYRCAVCGFAVRLNGVSVALEGAHIQWHRARGPDQVKNGLALCVLHHELFDAGAFTLSLDRRVVVAPSANGAGLDDSLGRFHLQEVSLPANESDFPDPRFLKWHHREVFSSVVGVVGAS